MNKDQQREFVSALEEIAVARGMDKMQLITAFEEALQQAYTRNVEPDKRVEVHLDAEKGELDPPLEHPA